ncbi:MAG: tetratricopeptide repeat protein [Candidatus Aminicenantes bacterium]|nr:tetratricopeptide repeat protein [Candidatus Aminicenantes bacterium]
MRLFLGLLLTVGLALPGPAQDRSKKAYELMYEDIQALKLQTQRIERRLDQSAADLKAVGDLVRDLVAQFKDYQKFQARNLQGLAEVPTQVRAIQEQLSQIEARLLQMSEDMLALKAPAPVETPAEPDPKAPGAKTKPEEKAPPAAVKAEGAPPPGDQIAPPSGLSAQEAYQAAMADYSKGNFDLAIDGFTLYREQFPVDPSGYPNPLLDNALFMIGESRFSQKKYAPAIEAFDRLLLEYPNSDKTAAAYLKKGFALVELKMKTEAVAVLRLLLAKYSLEEEAKQAREKLKELGDIK